MNPTVKILIGGTIGGAVGYFVGQVIVEYIHMRTDAEDIEIIEEESDTEEGSKEEYKMDKKKTKPKKEGLTNYEKMFKDRPDIRALVEKYETGKVDNTIGLLDTANYDEEAVDHEENADVDSGPIRIITMQEFANAEGYQRMTLSCYQDDIICDEKGNPIDRPEKIIGEEALLSFDETGIVYVLNDKNHCMYEICEMDEPFFPTNSSRRSVISQETRRGKKVIDYDDEEPETIED